MTVRWLSADEIDRVIDACTPARRLLVQFAFHTGMRPGEIASRHKEDIDLEGRLVRVCSRGEFRVKKDRPRNVPLTPVLYEGLLAAWDDLADEGPIFEGQSLRQSLKYACNKAGIEPLHPYGARHSFISRWAAEGHNRDALLKIVGHKDGKMIDQVYAHFRDEELANQMNKITWGRGRLRDGGRFPRLVEPCTGSDGRSPNVPRECSKAGSGSPAASQNPA